MFAGALIGTVVGGVCGLIGYLLAKKIFKDQKKAQTVSIIIMAGLMGGLMPFANNPNVQSKILSYISKDHAYERELNQKLLNYVKNTDYQNEANDLPATQLQQLVQKGLARLSDEDLIIWNQTRFIMANNSKPLCSALWNGNYQGINFVEILRTLNANQLELWLQVSATSLEAELGESSSNPPDENKLKVAISNFNASLNESETKKAQLVFAQGLSANPAEACWLMQSLMKYADENSKEDGIHISRWFAMAAAQTIK